MFLLYSSVVSLATILFVFVGKLCCTFICGFKVQELWRHQAGLGVSVWTVDQNTDKEMFPEQQDTQLFICAAIAPLWNTHVQSVAIYITCLFFVEQSRPLCTKICLKRYLDRVQEMKYSEIKEESTFPKDPSDTFGTYLSTSFVLH